MKLIAEIPEPWASDLKQLCIDAPPYGAIVECGVYKGGTAQGFYEVRGKRSIHLFDTWTGIPEKSDCDGIDIGKYNGGPELHNIRKALPEAKIYEGIFPLTFPREFPPISFAHLDFDQYVSTKHAIKRLWPLMLSGGIMAFDDFGFRGIQKAIDEELPGGTAAVQKTKAGIAYVVRN